VSHSHSGFLVGPDKDTFLNAMQARLACTVPTGDLFIETAQILKITFGHKLAVEIQEAWPEASCPEVVEEHPFP